MVTGLIVGMIVMHRMLIRLGGNSIQGLKNINRTSTSLSVISEHRLFGHEFDWDAVQILNKEPFYRKKTNLQNITYTSTKK